MKIYRKPKAGRTGKRYTLQHAKEDAQLKEPVIEDKASFIKKMQEERAAREAALSGDVNIPVKDESTSKKEVSLEENQGKKSGKVKMIINGNPIELSFEQLEKYKSLLADLEKSHGDRALSTIPLGDEYYKIRAELEDFVHKL